MLQKRNTPEAARARPGPFAWDDPFGLEDQLTDEERMIARESLAALRRASVDATLHRQREIAESLGAEVLLDRTDEPDEPLFVFADLSGHPFCIFVALSTAYGQP